MDQIIYSLLPEKVERVAGSGNKFVHLTEGKSDFYINLVPGFKHWDMCGSEAILQARFGIVTDAHLRPLLYDHDRNHDTLPDGIIAAKNKLYLDTCLSRIQNETGYSVAECQQLVARAAEETKRLRKQSLKVGESSREVFLSGF